MGNIKKKIKSISRNRNLLYSLLYALILLVANYFVNNYSVFTGESTDQYFLTQKICNFLGIHKNIDYGDAVYFNISYDKQFVPAYKGDYDNRVLIGNKIITDRSKLYEFLKLLEKTDTYEYVVIDISFDDTRDKTIYDDSLFTVISRMRDVVCATQEDLDRNEFLREKQAKAKYFVTPLQTNFCRYQFTFDGENSIASHIYAEKDENSIINRHGFFPFYFYSCNGKLCYNSLFLIFGDNHIHSNSNAEEYDDNVFSEIEVFNLGEYLNQKNDPYLKDSFLEDLASDTEDKYVVICNTENSDLHDTYIGTNLTGAQIIMRALTSLQQGLHYVKFIPTFIWLVIYFIIFYKIRANLSYLQLPFARKIKLKFSNWLRSFCTETNIKNNRFATETINFVLCLFRSKFVIFVFSLITYTAFLYAFSIIEYIAFEQVTSIFLPIITLSTYSLYNKFKNFN